MNTLVSEINPSLISWAQNLRYGNFVAEGGMIRSLLEWLDAQVDAAPRKQRLRDQTAARLSEQRLADEQQRKETEDARFAKKLIIAEACRVAYEQLSRSIEDAISVARLAYNRAVEDEELTRKALEETQAKAIVLPDGRRVYFSRDGHLYGEDLREITDIDAIHEARRRMTTDAPSLEAYLEIRKRHDAADELVQQLSRILEELDGLKQLQATVAASPEEIERRREALNRVVEGLPPNARADFDAMQRARLEDRAPFYVETDMTPASDAELAKAESDFAKQDVESEAEASPSRKPAYTTIPSF